MALDPQTPRRMAQRSPRGPFTRGPRAADAGLAIVVFLVTVLVKSEGPHDDLVIRSVREMPIASFLVLVAASGALYWRRARPLIVFGVTWVATAISIGVPSLELVGIAMMVALYSVGRYATSDRWSYVALGGAFGVAGLGSLMDRETAEEIGSATPGTLAGLTFGAFLIFFVWYIGRRMRFRAERAAQLEREHAAEARRAVAEERTRIARELHDVVAHRVSLMTVQAGAAKTVAADDLESAVQAMEAVEEAGRQALSELRHLLDVLRPETETEQLGPQPGIADVPRLVEQFERAGLVVSLTMDGVRTDLPARVDLSAYRIVQEALTNVLKHAGPTARADVRLSTDRRGIAIEVVDDGQGDTILPGSGQGIAGMRERAQLLGGSLDAEPRPGGGFRVIAHLPVGEERG
jgi:signal transduction histidine kinase